VAFLRIPPFPGYRPLPGSQNDGSWQLNQADAADVAQLLRNARVGGTFWGEQPVWPDECDVAVFAGNAAQLLEYAAVAVTECRRPFSNDTNSCDPWHIIEQADEIWTGADNEAALIAVLCGKKLRLFGDGRFGALADGAEPALLVCLVEELGKAGFSNPFTGQVMSPAAAIAQLSEWRGLIDANRRAGTVLGVARWKRVTMDALLWDGSEPVRHDRTVAAGQTALAWKSRSAPQVLKQLEDRGISIGEIEDGMIRSTGLGANCVPPLSVIVDFDGVHFDPSCSSGLERILADSEMPFALIERAAALRKRLVTEGISKYGRDAGSTCQADGGQRRILVTGQVEDDRSVMTGGAGQGNLELLRRTRELEPGAHITFKPHPDVEAGHRKGHIPDVEIRRYADAIERQSSIIAAIDAAAGLHVLTSLAGFEALMRGKDVTCHGIPFYAGWGLTRDLAAVPACRGRQRSLDELVAAVLILYPRYLDPVTRLPCPVEVLVERMAAGQANITSPLVSLRQWQGRLSRWIGHATGLFK
jgi:capsular polysaccharide export protein